MLKRLAALVLTLTVFSAAADFWESIPSNHWTQRQIDTILAKSPWAHTARMENSAIPQEWSVVVLWSSALPIELAWRQQNALGGFVQAKGYTQGPDQDLESNSQFYAVRLEGTKLLTSDPTATKARLLKATRLRIEGKPDIYASDVRFLSSKHANVRGIPHVDPNDLIVSEILFLFSRNPNLSVADRQIEFESKDIEYSNLQVKSTIRKSFKLKEMMFQGSLAL